MPPEVGAKEDEFYMCGSCGQIFWPGEKYVETMDSLRSVVSEKAASGSEQQAAVACSRAERHGFEGKGVSGSGAAAGGQVGSNVRSSTSTCDDPIADIDNRIDATYLY